MARRFPLTEKMNHLKVNLNFHSERRAKRAAAVILCAVAALFFAVGPVFASAQKAPQAAQGKSEFDRISAEASQARKANQLKRAIALYERAVKLKPRWAEGWWYLGTIYYDGDLYARGVDAFKNLVELDPTLGAAWAMLGLCEFETAGTAKNPAESRNDYGNSFIHLNLALQKGLPSDKDLSKVVDYHLALLDIMHGDFEAGYQLLRGLAFQGAVSEQVRFALGLSMLRVPLLPSQVDPTKDALIDKAGEAGELIALENFNQAETVFKQLIQEYPTTPFVHFAYGAMLARLAQFDKGEEQFKAEIKVNPDSPWPYMQLAYVELRLRQYQDALTNARKSHDLLPTSFIPHYLIGRALLGLNQVHAAVQELQAAKQGAPNVAEIRFNLAMALARDKQPKAAAAEREAFQRLEATIQQKRRLVPSSGILNNDGMSDTQGMPNPDAAKEPPGNIPQ